MANKYVRLWGKREKEREREGGGEIFYAFSFDLIPDVDKMTLPRVRIIVM